MSNFDEARYVLLTVKITTKKLYLMAYSSYQESLFDLVVDKRERVGLTFKAIAEQLVSDGYASPRGKKLEAENVFSIYKKGKLRRARLEETASYELLEVNVR